MSRIFLYLLRICLVAVLGVAIAESPFRLPNFSSKAVAQSNPFSPLSPDILQALDRIAFLVAQSDLSRQLQPSTTEVRLALERATMQAQPYVKDSQQLQAASASIALPLIDLTTRANPIATEQFRSQLQSELPRIIERSRDFISPQVAALLLGLFFADLSDELVASHFNFLTALQTPLAEQETVDTLILTDVPTANALAGQELKNPPNLGQLQPQVQDSIQRWLRIRSNVNWRLSAKLTQFASYSPTEDRSIDFSQTLPGDKFPNYILPRHVQVMFTHEGSENSQRVASAPILNLTGLTLQNLLGQPVTLVESNITTSPRPTPGDSQYLQYGVFYTLDRDRIPAGSATVTVTYTLTTMP